MIRANIDRKPHDHGDLGVKIAVIMLRARNSADHDCSIMIGAVGVCGYRMSLPGSDVGDVEAGVSGGGVVAVPE
jgi:hypothetical protein